jgi:xanthine dehydrogenase molybdopterin-binding subunit B
MRRMGGGFGGRNVSALSAAAAVAARHVAAGHCVHRDDDFLITGKRHCFHYEYDAVDDDGTILAADIEMGARRLPRPRARACARSATPTTRTGCLTSHPAYA